MSTQRLLPVFALTGCNVLLDLDPGTPADSLGPSCATGWKSRIPIDVANATTATIEDYPVAVPLATSSLSGLRFGIDERTPPLPFIIDDALPGAWVAIPALPPGTTRIHAYYDNPDAQPWAGPSPFDSDLIANPSFESIGGWTITDSGATIDYSDAWASHGRSSLAVDAYRSAGALVETSYGVSQRVRFPSGSDYVLRFDVTVVAASNSGLNSSGEFFVSIGDGLVTGWRKSGDEGNITGVYRDVETIPFGAGDVGIMLGVTLRGGSSSSYAKGFYDNVRVRKHVSPEPGVTVHAPESACAR